MTANTYEFDADFQSKIIAMMMRDETFMARIEGLVDPAYFENGAQGYLADLTNSHFKKYRQVPSATIVLNELKDRKARKLIKDELLDDVKLVLKDVYGSADLSNRDYMVEQVSRFAQRRAVEEAIISTADKLDNGADLDELRPILSKALEVGSVDGLGGFDLLENLEDRTERRIDEDSGKIPKRGIKTGLKEMDAELYHEGLGIKEMTLLMGGPKAGKSIALMNIGVNASLAGYNVLFVTLEVSKEIQADRIDAYLSSTSIRSLKKNAVDVKVKVKNKLVAPTTGLFKLEEWPTGTFTVSDLRRLIRRYESQSVKFDLIVVDYADIMAAETPGLEERAQMKEIYTGLRGLAQEEDVALLTATQTNREGAKAQTAHKTHVAEDFNKVRLADVVIAVARVIDGGVNQTVFTFVAHRNGEEGQKLVYADDRDKMKLAHAFVGRR